MEAVYLEMTYYQFMSDNVRLWMGAFKSMSITERGTGTLQMPQNIFCELK